MLKDIFILENIQELLLEQISEQLSAPIFFLIDRKFITRKFIKGKEKIWKDIVEK